MSGKAVQPTLEAQFVVDYQAVLAEITDLRAQCSAFSESGLHAGDRTHSATAHGDKEEFEALRSEVEIWKAKANATASSQQTAVGDEGPEIERLKEVADELRSELQFAEEGAVKEHSRLVHVQEQFNLARQKLKDMQKQLDVLKSENEHLRVRSGGSVNADATTTPAVPSPEIDRLHREIKTLKSHRLTLSDEKTVLERQLAQCKQELMKYKYPEKGTG
jgi:uncharacterized coiled-coil DUF342 family protein